MSLYCLRRAAMRTGSLAHRSTANTSMHSTTALSTRNLSRSTISRTAASIPLNSTTSSTQTPTASHVSTVIESDSSPTPPEYLSQSELHIFNKLKDRLQPTRLEVQDVSGGCGSMYALDIVAQQFKGLSVIKQHRLVNAVLADEIKKWHGVQLKTKAP